MDLQILWFVLIAVLWGGYFLLEGFDFGVGMLLPFLPRNERQRSTMFETIGPVWDGNEVWLVIAGGATFAAFPAWYATMFSGFYIALLLLLVLLIVRVLSFEWREKSESPAWRRVWTWANAIGSCRGVADLGHRAREPAPRGPARLEGRLRRYLRRPVHRLFGAGRCHGRARVRLPRSHLPDDQDARRALRPCRPRGAGLSVAAVLVGSGFLAWTVAVAVDRNDKDVFPPVLPAALGAGALVLAVVFVHRRRSGLAFAATALGAVLLVATLFTSLYPRVMVSQPGLCEQPHRLRRGVRALHAEGDLDRRRSSPGDPRLPGLDLSRVPATARRRRARTGRRRRSPGVESTA